MKKRNFFLDLTVLIPCYNAENTIDKLMQSIERQKYPLDHLKIIATNDGSTDDTLTKLNVWFKKFGADVMTVIDQTNVGIAESRNILMDNVKTKWFTFIDSDDYYESKAFRHFCGCSKNQTVDVIVSKTYRRNGKKKTSWWLTNWMSTSIHHYIGNNIFFAWNKVYRTDFLRDVVKFKYLKGNDMMEDQAFFASLAPKIKKIGKCNHFTYNFVYSDNSLSSVVNYKKNEDKFIQMMNNLDYSLTNMLQNKSYKQLSRKEKRIFSVVVYNFAMQVFLTYVLFPAWYGFEKNVQDELKYIFYTEKRQIFTKILEQHRIKFRMPFGWWRKITYICLRLKNRFKSNKFRMHTKHI
ncbi:MAG: hypothetical protein Ta2E_06840 [Mycoplasmoidaceae bacterium]|nr:MAG: hypothetical protein Ta2E_06840 [Mycoplasmoidaceae bacterium]